MVIVDVSDARHVLVCDGEVHPASRPKRKNIRHLAPAAAVHPEIAAGGEAHDDMLRAWLLHVAPPEGEGA